MPPTEGLVSYSQLTASNEMSERASVLMPIQIAFMTTSQALIILVGLYGENASIIAAEIC